MSKSFEHEHPALNSKDTFLCLIGSDFFAGKFSKKWFGWSFGGWVNPAGYQFDAPGWNSSDWKQIWKIVRK
jgi:hypothetical protein